MYGSPLEAVALPGRRPHGSPDAEPGRTPDRMRRLQPAVRDTAPDPAHRREPGPQASPARIGAAPAAGDVARNGRRPPRTFRWHEGPVRKSDQRFHGAGNGRSADLGHHLRTVDRTVCAALAVARLGE